MAEGEFVSIEISIALRPRPVTQGSEPPLEKCVGHS